MLLAKEPEKPPAKPLINALLPKPVVWIASSKDDISAMPDPVKASFGHRLREVEEDRTPLDTKPLP
jgi:phage-related protein